MYNKQLLISKVDKMFEDLKKQSYEIISIHSDFSVFSKDISELVYSEVTTRSKTLFTDMYAQMSENTLSSPAFNDPAKKIKFYEANIRGEILSKYSLDAATSKAFQRGMQYKEFNRLYPSIAIAGGTTAAGGVLKYALATIVNVPIAVIFTCAAGLFCVSYFKVIPNKNSSAFREALEKFLLEVKKEFILWFDKIEIYYDNRIQALVKTFKEG